MMYSLSGETLIIRIESGQGVDHGQSRIDIESKLVDQHTNGKIGLYLIPTDNYIFTFCLKMIIKDCSFSVFSMEVDRLVGMYWVGR